MDFESLLFVPNRLVDDYRNRLKDVLEESEDVAEELKVPEIEKAEALEALGMSEFYQGDYQVAWKHLKDSLSYKFPPSVRSSRRVCLCMIYLGLCSYKLGDLQSADDEMQKAFYLAESSHLYDLQALALINRSVVLIKKDVLTVAITTTKQAIDILSQHHVCEKDSYQYRQYVYVLVMVYVKTREFHKAEVLVEETAFPERERILLEAGLCMGVGKLHKAHNILHNAYIQLHPPTTTAANLPPATTLPHTHTHTHTLHIGEEGGSEGGSVMGEGWGEGLGEEGDDEPACTVLDRYVHKIQIVYNLSLINQLYLHNKDDHHTDNASSSAGDLAGASVSTYSVQSHIQTHTQHLDMLKDLMRITKGLIFKLYQQYTLKSDVGMGVDDLPFYSPNVPHHSHTDSVYMSMECMYRALSLYGIMCLAYAEGRNAGESWGHKAGDMVQLMGVKSGERGLDVLDDGDKGGLDRYDEELKEKLQDIEKYFQKALTVYDLLRISEETNNKDTTTTAIKEEEDKADNNSLNGDNNETKEGITKEEQEQTVLAAVAAVEAIKTNTNTTNTSSQPGSVSGSANANAMDMDDLDSVLSSIQGMDMSSHIFNPDVLLVQDYVRNVHLYASLSTMHTVPLQDLHAQMQKVYSKLSAESAKVIKLHGVDLNPTTGIVQNNRGGQGGQGGGAIGNSKATSNTNNHKSVPAAAPVYVPPKEYVSEKIDGVSRMSEVMIMTNRLGRDEISGWIGWALANCYMVSMGYLGTSCISGGEFQTTTLPSTSTTNNPKTKTPPGVGPDGSSPSLLLAGSNVSADPTFLDPPPIPSSSLLIEIRNRLLELNLKLSFTFEHDDSYQFNELEMLICCLIILIKITTMLHMKTDIPPLLIQLLKAVDLLFSKKPCHESCAYVCIANKFKCEYEDWLTTPFMSAMELAHHYTITLLPMYRKYMKTCEYLPSDIYGEMKKDAYKKMMNIYTLIYKCSVSSNDGTGKPTSSSNNTNTKSSNVSVGSHSSSISKDKNFSEDEVLHMDEGVVEEFEGDERWVMRYGKVRAMVFFRKMKQLVMNNM